MHCARVPTGTTGADARREYGEIGKKPYSATRARSLMISVDAFKKYGSIWRESHNQMAENQSQ